MVLSKLPGSLPSSFLYKENYAYFQSFDIVRICYNNGQVEVSKLLSSVFNTLLDNVEFLKIKPKDSRLFQAADLVATLRLLQIKLEKNELSRAEELFFINHRNIRKNYIKILEEKTRRI